MWRERPVLVTGVSGFVGGAVARHLVGAGVSVRGLVRPGAALPCGVAAFTASGLDDRRALAAAVGGVETVVHCAGLAHVHGRLSAAGLEALRRTNVDGAREVFDAAVRAGASSFVFMSSVAAAVTTSAVPVPDDIQPAPSSPYGRVKRDAEILLTSRERGAMRLLILRPPMIYGPGMKGNPRLLLRALAAGLPLPLDGIQNSRTILYVDNLASAVCAGLDSAATDEKPYFVGDAGTVSTTELVRALAEGLGKKPLLFGIPAPVRGFFEVRTGAQSEDVTPRLGGLFASLPLDTRRFERDAPFVAPFTSADGLRHTGESYRRGRW